MTFPQPQPTPAIIGAEAKEVGKTHVRPGHQEKALAGLDPPPVHTPPKTIQGQQRSLLGRQTSLVRGSAAYLTVGLHRGGEQPGHPTLNHHRWVNFTYLAYFGVPPFTSAGTLGLPSQRLSSLPSQRVIADCNNCRAEKLWLLVLQKSLFLLREG